MNSHIARHSPEPDIVALDSIYVVDGEGEPVFRRLPPPSDAEVARVAERIHRRVANLMERRGLGPQADPDEADALRRDEVDSEDGALPSGRCCASVAGFSVHACVCVPARDRMRLQRLARLCRPPHSALMRTPALCGPVELLDLQQWS